MPAKKPLSKEKVEQKEYLVYNPEDIKQAVEIPVKSKPPISQIEIIEKVGKPKPVKKRSSSKKIKSNASTHEANNSKNPESSEFYPKKLNPKGYVLVITEKPQAASKIASALANGKEHRVTNAGVSYYELTRNNKKIIVCCAVGHLFSVSQTKKGTDYPVFDIAWFPNFKVRKKDFTKKYYQVIERLAKNASEIVVATDFDTEGEVIGYNIVRFIAGQKDAKRMKFSSLTAKELQDSYDNPHATIEWGQAIAGETRHFLDWMYGINLSRALMNAIKSTGKFRIMSIGRVQGPALNLIVEKEKQIQAFKSTPYWQVFITISDGKNKTELKHNKDITKKSDLDKFKNLTGQKAIAVTKKTKQTIPPPSPFDLTSLQTEAYKFYSITPSQTLAIAQKLYLAGLISYPRTSSQKIPEAMQPLKILKQLSNYFSETEKTTRKTPIEGKKSDPAHPAIIPTGNYEKLENQDNKIYELIVKRFISCFCDDAELENKSVEVEVDVEYESKQRDSELDHKVLLKEKLKFNERGMEIIKTGWTEVYPVKMVEESIKDFNGEVLIEKLRTEEKMTQPPKRYSPASILSELEKRNLGTKATRANILETLYDRNYIIEKSIKATELGIRLIDSLKKYSPIIIDEKLTREMEKEMDNIRASKKDLERKEEHVISEAKNALIKISKDFKKNENALGKELIHANGAMWEQQREENKLELECPECKKGVLTLKFSPRFKNYFIACTNYPECKKTFSLPSKSLIKKAGKKCEECNWPMMISIRSGKRPWIFCFNPNCITRKQKNNNNNENENENNISNESADEQPLN
jgi:DNA topoisomerase I